MSDSKTSGSFFSKTVKKKADRAKEKLIQKIGKADKTTDERFNDHVHNFHKQQAAGGKLHRELKNYLASLKNMQMTSKCFFEALLEVHEPEWVGFEELKSHVQTLEVIWDHYHEKINDQALSPLVSYESQFPDIKGKISKRGRKLVDYDGSRHAFESISTTQQKSKKEEAKDLHKVVKAQEELDEAKKVYEEIHTELMDELPALYDSRISFYISNAQSIFSAETNFHNEASKIHNKLSNVMDTLADEAGKGIYNTRRSSSSSSTSSQQHKNNDKVDIDNTVNEGGGAREEETFSTPTSTLSGASDNKVTSTSLYPRVPTEGNNQTSTNPFDDDDDDDAKNHDETLKDNDDDAAHVRDAGDAGDDDNNPFNEKEEEEVAVVVAGGGEKNQNKSKFIEEIEAKTLYKVEATHKYDHEDEDELSFEAGEIIHVIPYDDPEDQDDGWLMGVKLSNGKKGVFPANFTKQI